MKIDANYQDLGFREIYRLTSFIQLMCDTNPEACLNGVFMYNSYSDEPAILDESGYFFASDFDIAFTKDNKACYYLPLNSID